MEKIKKLDINYEKMDNKGYGFRLSSTGYASVDKPWLSFYPLGVEKTEIPDVSMYGMLKMYNHDNMDSVAMRYFGIPIKYKKYFENINKFAKSFSVMGLKKGDMIALVLPNIPECRELIYAANMLGIVVYPISPSLSANDFKDILSRNNVKMVFMFDLFYKKYADVLSKSSSVKDIVVCDGKSSIPMPLVKLSELRSKLAGDYRKIEVPSDYRNMKFSLFEKQAKRFTGQLEEVFEKNSVAVVIGTSGTTGTSKGVCLTNENLNAMALQHLVGDMNFEKGDRLLDILIQSIGYGIAVAHYTGVCSLEGVLIPELITHILPHIEKNDISHFTGGPVHYEDLLKDLNESGKKFPKTKNMVSGGASLPKEIERLLNHVDEGYVEDENSDIIVRQGLGCTENGGAATYAKKGSYKFGGVGIPLAFETMGVFKPGTDEELKYGEIGELCITGPTVMHGYLNNEEETNNVLKVHRDGKVWLHTCDLGTIDEDGQVFISDRIKDIFMRKGFNVHPSKITEFVDSIDIVDCSKTIGVSHPDEQMVPLLFVKLKKEVDLNIAKDYILNLCYQNLEETSIPYEIVFVDEMPRNLGGKIDGNYLLKISGIDYFNEEKGKQLQLLKTAPSK